MTTAFRRVAWVSGVLVGVGVAAFAQTRTAPAVQYLPAEKVNATFTKGGPLIETDTYKVQASRRDRDGQAEVHARDTDIFWIQEGTATLVTGGEVVNGKETAPDERRGETITSGKEQRVAKGDIITIPNGVPHMFKDVKAPFVYYTVKVTAPRP